MQTFHYKARDGQGVLQQGSMAAVSPTAVAEKLQAVGLTPVSITQGQAGSGLSRGFWARFRRVKLSEINLFTRQLYILQRAGLPIIASLNALKEQTVDHALKGVIGRLIRDLEGGANLATAFERHPGVFSPLYISMIRSGELSGRLPEVLERLAVIGENEERLQRKIKAALRYPAMVVAALCLGFIILITFVVPRFQEIYSQKMAVLPLPTRILIGLNTVLTHYWWVLLGGGVVALWLAQRFFRTAKGTLFWDTFKLKMPVFGPLFLKIAMSRFGRLTAMLLKSGVPLMQILDLVQESVGNQLIARSMEKIKDSVNEGGGMRGPMKESGLFPPVVLQMVAVGEETGNLDELLLHVAEYYDEQIDYTISNLVSLIEPLLLLVLGTGVAIMALGIFMPMWQLIKIFKHG